MTNQRLEARLGDLQKELEAGQKMVADLDAKRANLTATLLRIEGAIHVLRELVAEPRGEQAPPSAAAG